MMALFKTKLIKGIIQKEIKKEISFFYFEEINSKIIDSLILFCSKNPKTQNSTYIDGKNIILDSISIKLNNDKPSNIFININNGGIIERINLYPNKYYYFTHDGINSVTDLKDIELI